MTQTTVDRSFLLCARYQLGAVDTLNLLSLISIGPGQYKTKDLTEYCQAQRSNLSASLKRLHEAEWIRYCSLGKNGIYIWFIRTCLTELYQFAEKPAWVLSDNQPGEADATTQIHVGEIEMFAAIHGLNPRTVRNFLNGKAGSVLAGRWSVKRTPPTKSYLSPINM
jgi:hypothetical protein